MHDVIIIGGGPAGLTAAIYTTRANLKTLVIAGEQWGGQPMTTTEIENYPGFPEGIMGPDLMDKMRKQAEKFGAEIVNKSFTKGELTRSPFKVIVGEKEYECKSIIIATGGESTKLGIPGEKELMGKGVAVCATCDAGFYRGKKVAIAGGGDVAMEEAIMLSSFASEVYLIHRREEFRASQIMQKRVLDNPKIKPKLNTQILEILGKDRVTGLKLKNNSTGKIEDLPIDGVFLAIGKTPSSSLFAQLEKDEKGYIISNNTKTNIEGVFVAGDVMDRRYRQVITAAASGCQAALEVEKWLRDN